MQRLQSILAIALAGCAVDSELPEAPDTTTDEVAPQVMRQLPGLTANDGLLRRHQLSAADGIDHVRYRQTYRGVPVNHHGATAVMTNGRIANVIDHTIKGIDVDVNPTISKDEAIAMAMKDVGRELFAKAELVIDADTQRQVKRTRSEATPVNADEIERTVLRHVLVWEVLVGDDKTVMAYVYDAHTGALRDKHEAAVNENATVWASSEYAGAQMINVVKNESPCGTFEMVDWQRSHFLFAPFGGAGSTYFSNTAAFGDAEPPNQDYSDGGTCDPREGHANDQTAAVDAEFNFGVTWDMYKNVFGITSWDNANESGGIYVHMQEDNSHYVADFQPFSYAHIDFGDGDWQNGATPHTAVTVVGHEYTHGVDQHLGSLGSLSKGNVISEGIADLGGALVKMYDHDGGWNNSAAHITDDGVLDDLELGGQVMQSTGVLKKSRFLDRPSKDGVSPDVYFDGIDDLDPHYSSGPLRRAFYFIMRGASAHDDWRHDPAWASNTPLLPWGLPGLGIDKGSKIFFNTFFNCLDDADYNDALGCAQFTALELFGLDAMNTVTNAFAGVNVGSTAGYPAGPKVFFEQEPNESSGEATNVDWSAAPAGFENVFKMTLIGNMFSASDVDEYKFTARCGRHIGALLAQPPDLGTSANALSMRLFWQNPATGNWVAEGAATDPTTTDPTLSLDATGFCTGTGEQTFIMKVTSSGGASGFPYQVFMDAE